MKLFKYVPPERIDIFKTKLIRFTPHEDWNDPYEMKPFLFNENRFKFLHFYSDNKTYLTTEIYKFINANLVSLSISENPESLLMWANYAKNHSGYLVEFDIESSFFNNSSRYLFRIPYSNNRPVICKSQIHPLFTEIRDNLHKKNKISKLDFQRFSILFTKSLEWEYEKEWRLITLPEFGTIKDGICLFDIPSDTIKSITFGLKTSRKDKESVTKYVSENFDQGSVHIYNTSLDNEHYKLNYLPVKIIY